MKTSIEARFQVLLAEGQELISRLPSTQASNPNWIARAHLGDYQAWLTSTANLLRTATPANSQHRRDCERLLANKFLPTGIPVKVIRRLHGLLQAAKADWDNGFLPVGATPIGLSAESETSRPRVFVLMPFAGRFNDLYQLVLKTLETRLEVQVKRADDLPFDQRQIYDRIIEAISGADVIIADLSDRNPNVFYELGYAHALSKTVVPIASGDLPFDVAGFPTIFYQADDLAGLIEPLLLRVREVLECDRKPGSRELPRDVAELDQILGYAIRKAQQTNWSRPKMYFTEAEVAATVGIDPEQAYAALNDLRDLGFVVCVNWKGDAVWMAASKLENAGIGAYNSPAPADQKGPLSGR